MKNDKPPFPRVKAAFSHILHSELFRLNGEKIDLPGAIIALCEAIESEYVSKDDSCSIWYLGEGSECCLCDFIAGAFWSLSEWHGGQSSPEYQALSMLGQIYSPGGTSPPDSADEPEWTAYNACNEWFQNHGKI